MALSRHGLAITAHSETIDPATLTAILGMKQTKSFECHNPLDLLKDDKALDAFSFDNFVRVGMSGHITGTWFMLPNSLLSLAVRREGLSVDQRLSLIDMAYTLLCYYNQNYPKTGVNDGITTNNGKIDIPMTLWTPNTCMRQCNLCVALSYAIEKWRREGCPYDLALERIGTHSLECLFGTTRMMLNGKTHFADFLSALVNGVMILEIQEEFKMGHCTRRFKKNMAGCTLPVGGKGGIQVDLGQVAHNLIWTAVNMLQPGVEPSQRQAVLSQVMIPFSRLNNELMKHGRGEVSKMSGNTSGSQITSRFVLLQATGKGSAKDLDRVVEVAMD
jgi:hypothetical protein